MMEERGSGKRGSGKWRRRFFISSGLLMISNILLLFWLASVQQQKHAVLESTKIDAQVLSHLLSNRITRDQVEQALKENRWKLDVEKNAMQLHVGGITFYVDDSGNVQKVVHWSQPAAP